MEKPRAELCFLSLRTCLRVPHGHIAVQTAMTLAVWAHLYLSVSVAVMFTLLLCIVRAPDNLTAFSGVIVVTRNLHVEIYTHFLYFLIILCSTKVRELH